MPVRERTLLFDFDGTLSLGTGPVLAYARIAAEVLTPSAAEAFLGAVADALTEHPSGRVPGTGAIDGYDLVRILSARHGIDPETLGAAYLDSRELLGSVLAPVIAPAGLPAFLAEARTSANLIVATNAPETRIEAAIDALGLGGLFDAVYTSLSKPAGLATVLDDWMPRGPVLSIGDIWANDLAPAHARGAYTALVGPLDDDPLDATPTYRAEHLPELYPAITEWLTALHPSTNSTPIERQRT